MAHIDNYGTKCELFDNKSRLESHPFCGGCFSQGLLRNQKKVNAITDKIPKELFRFCGFRPEVEKGLGQT